MDDQVLAKLCNADALPLDQAIQLAKHIIRIEPLLDIELAHKLPRRDQISSGDETQVMDDRDTERVLEILDVISEGRRLVQVIGHLIRHTNPRVRSKAAVVIGRRVQNVNWTGKYFQEMDPRVRANVVEALWGSNTPGARDIFTQAQRDSNNRVVGNALYGLYLAGDPEAPKRIRDLAQSLKPEFRGTAAWVMGKTGDSAFQEVLKAMMRDENARVRSVVFSALLRLKNAATSRPQPLQSMAG